MNRERAARGSRSEVIDHVAAPGTDGALTCLIGFCAPGRLVTCDRRTRTRTWQDGLPTVAEAVSGSRSAKSWQAVVTGRDAGDGNPVARGSRI